MEWPVSVELQYRRVGTRIEVGSFTACPPNALCVANDTGTISGAGIILTGYRYGSRSAVSLARVAP